MRNANSEAVVASHKRRTLPLACVTGASLLAITTATVYAQSTGIATCDDFLTKYDTCVTSKLPAAQRDAAGVARHHHDEQDVGDPRKRKHR